MNACNFTGNLGKPWDVSYTNDGKCVARNTMALKKYNGDTLWINITAFGKNGENLSKHTDKGAYLSILAEYDMREYEKDGQKKYFHSFNISKFTFGPKNQQNNQNQGYQNQGQQQNQSGYSNTNTGGGYGAPPDDDIPFGPII